VSVKNLDVLFNPKRIAVIGADDDASSIGYNIFRNLLGQGFKGSVYPVNSQYESVQGVEAYPKITDITKDIDLAIIAVPPDEIIPVLEECGQKGVKGSIIFCPDFKNRVNDLQLTLKNLIQISSKYNIRILGPDSLGFIRPKNRLNASLFPQIPPQGNIAFIVQSVTLSTTLLDLAVNKNIGCSFFISVGTKVDIKFADLIDYLGVDPETRAIILYIESIKNGRRFMTAVRSFASSKPIIVIKPGKFDISAQVALTHSGFIAGEDKVYDAAFKRAGVIRVDEILDLFYVAESLAKQSRPKGNRLAIITNSGGPAIIAVDNLIRFDGQLAVFNHDTIQSIQSNLKAIKIIQNPLDLFFEAPPEEYHTAVKLCLKDSNVDGLLVIHTPSYSSDPRKVAQAVVSAARSYPYKPTFTLWMGEEQVHDAREFLNTQGIPTFTTPEQAIRSFIYMYRYEHNLNLLLEVPEVILKDFEPNEDNAEEIIKNASNEKRLILNFNEVKEILSSYGIPVVPTHIVKNEEEAIKTAETIGYPVALKIDSQKIIHKLEYGGVLLNLKDQISVKKAYQQLQTLAIFLKDPHANVIIQPMIVEHGYELAIGVKKDPTFGSVIIFGTGGELFEIVEDFSIGLPPLNQALARQMMAETKIYKYLQTQKRYSSSLKHLEEILVRLSHLVIHFPHIKELDINPFFLTEENGFVLDASIILEADVLEGFQPIRGDFCPPHLSICPYPDQYIDIFKLKDGTSVIIRPIRPEDKPLIEELLKASSEETLMMRFFRKTPDIPHEQIIRFCHVDYDRELAFVATIREGNRERIIGDVRMSKQPDLENAEMAVFVGDRWQGQGVGKTLCLHCLRIAKELGIKRMWMEILKTNIKMLKNAERLGFKQTSSDEDSVRVALDLQDIDFQKVLSVRDN
jgi:acetyltransferase